MKGSCILVVFLCYMFPRGVANAQYLGNDYIEDPRNVLADFDRLRTLMRKYAANDDREIRRNVNDYDDELKNWTGQWMPHRPNDPTLPPKIFPKVDQSSVLESSQSPHGVPMGYPSKSCDDAKTNLTLDWDGNPINYTCYDKRIVPDRNIIAIKYCERIPKYYVAIHKCMYEEIEYDDNVPVFGPHRPLWPIYGEYKFLPRQRWLHNLEHGAILALYHPCANPMEVKRLKSLLRGCLRRHVISPSNLLDEHRPLALVAWGCRLSMSYVNPKLVVKFIREHALRGPEEIARDGDFSDGLIRRAKIVSDLDDTMLCPNARIV
ncbi:PREDICTED: uncharacterized protein LOC108550930 isoform X2 [Eufriesea mexicana]|uniref:uncharacterized protein LOC108550930 isoform X2 n=1 Tax=Eufriesea mexicana TaxID=516756 RepID=UPI00083BA77A|nr:PREDICTED: uncharacterized protein LOC108550930 isoform X2 [Eufriesea mexicana]